MSTREAKRSPPEPTLQLRPPPQTERNPTLPCGVLIYFQINPLLRCLTCEIPNPRPGVSADRFMCCLASLKQSRTILCRLSMWFCSRYLGRLAQADQGARSCIINHCWGTYDTQNDIQNFMISQVKFSLKPEIASSDFCLKRSLGPFFTQHICFIHFHPTRFISKTGISVVIDTTASVNQ